MVHLVLLKWNVEKKFFSISFLKRSVSQAGFQIDALFWLDESQFENYVKQNQFFGTNGMKIKLKGQKMSL